MDKIFAENSKTRLAVLEHLLNVAERDEFDSLSQLLGYIHSYKEVCENSINTYTEGASDE